MLDSQRSVEIRITPTQWLVRGIGLPANLCQFLREGFIAIDNFSFSIDDRNLYASSIENVTFTFVNNRTLIVTIKFTNDTFSMVFENPTSNFPSYTPQRDGHTITLTMIFKCVRERVHNQMCVPAYYFIQQNNLVAEGQQQEQEIFRQSISENYTRLKSALSLPNTYLVFLSNGLFEVRYLQGSPVRELSVLRGNYQVQMQSQGQIQVQQQQQQQQQTQQTFVFQERGIKTVDAVPSNIDSIPRRMEEEQPVVEQSPKQVEKQDSPKSIEKVEEQQVKLQSLDLSEEYLGDEGRDSATVSEEHPE